MKQFIKQIALFSIVLSIPLFLFILLDPYMVFGEHRGQLNSGKDYHVTENRGFVSTELFLQNYKEEQYDAFILGNSRSFIYNTKKWKTYIGNAHPFHFNASAESLFGIVGKLNLLEEHQVDIKHAIVVLDVGLLVQTKNSNDFLFKKHPEVSKESYLVFYKEMFKGFFPKPMFAFLDLYLTNTRKPYMARYGIVENVWKHQPKTNEFSYHKLDSILAVNPEEYYSGVKFPQRDSVEVMSDSVIQEEQKVLLKRMKAVFQANGTNFKLVINPLYDQRKLNTADLNYLQTLFGKTRVFDFSGVNTMTQDYRNYYELSHYRPHIANEIMEELYSKNQTQLVEHNL